jgi:hypothetical protein
VKAPLGVVHEEILKLLDSITVADLSSDMPKMPPRLYTLSPARAQMQSTTPLPTESRTEVTP